MNIPPLTPPEFRKILTPGGAIYSRGTVSPTFAQKPDRFQPLFVGSDTEDEKKKRKRRQSSTASSRDPRAGFSPGQRQGGSQYSGLPGTPSETRGGHNVQGTEHDARDKRPRESTASHPSQRRPGVSPGHWGPTQYAQLQGTQTQEISSGEVRRIIGGVAPQNPSGMRPSYPPDDTQVLSTSSYPLPHRPHSSHHDGQGGSANQAGKKREDRSSSIASGYSTTSRIPETPVPHSPYSTISSAAIKSPTPLPGTPEYMQQNVPYESNPATYSISANRLPHSNQEHGRQPAYSPSITSTVPSLGLTQTKLHKPVENPLYTLYVAKRFYENIKINRVFPGDMKSLSPHDIDEILAHLNKEIQKELPYHETAKAQQFQREVATLPMLLLPEHEPNRPSTSPSPSLKYSQIMANAKYKAQIMGTNISSERVERPPSSTQSAQGKKSGGQTTRTTAPSRRSSHAGGKSDDSDSSNAPKGKKGKERSDRKR